MINKRLKSSTIFSFIVLGMIGIRLVTLPHDIAIYAKNDSWISIIFAAIPAFISAFIYLWLYSKHPGLNFSQIVEKVMGKFLGKLSLLLLGACFFSAISLSLRLFAESIHMYLLEDTPPLVIMSLILLASVYALTLDAYSLGIIMEMLLPIILFFIILLCLFSLSVADFSNLSPLLSKGVYPIAQGTLQVADPILGTIICAYILPYFESSKNNKKWALLGTGIGMSIYLLIIVICIAVLGSTELTYLVYPVIVVAKSIQFETALFERAESLFMASWIPNTFTSVLILYLMSSLNLKVIFNARKKNLIILLQLPIFVFIARFPKNLAEVMQYYKLLSYVTFGLGIVYLPLLVILTKVKERRNNHDA